MEFKSHYYTTTFRSYDPRQHRPPRNYHSQQQRYCLFLRCDLSRLGQRGCGCCGLQDRVVCNRHVCGVWCLRHGQVELVPHRRDRTKTQGEVVCTPVSVECEGSHRVRSKARRESRHFPYDRQHESDNLHSSSRYRPWNVLTW